jgi:Ca2+-binding EF-hand superfamily protein
MRADLFVAVLLVAGPGVMAGVSEGAGPQRRGAQGAQPQNMRFAGMDANGDGVITRDEWRGTDDSFRVHDWNGDGVLSGAEVRPGARRPSRRGDFSPAARQEFDDWTPARFRELDHNRDGRLTRDEWHYDTESFSRADRNRDGIVSRDEFLGDGMDDDREDRFRHLDANRNGRIEREEWHGSRDAFEWLDRDRDGVLSRMEVIGQETEEEEGDLFGSLDINRNGVVSRNEWHWSRGSFDRLDRDRNGVLSREELRAAETPAGTGGTGSSGAVTEIRVDPAVRWTETGVFVRQGEAVTIEASGTIQMSTNPGDVAEPNGARSGRQASEAPLAAYPAGALIVRVGESGAYYAGSRSTFKAPAAGQLYFGVNDDHLLDNSGEYRVTVTQAAAPRR